MAPLNFYKVSAKSGHHLRDPFRNPITNTEHINVKFLSRFLEFLIAWQNLDVELLDNQKLSNY